VEPRQEKMQQRRIRTNTNGSERIQHLNNILMHAEGKETFKEAKQEILKENIASTLGTKPGDDVPVYDMPHLFDDTSRD
jgi:hypothetical protein